MASLFLGPEAAAAAAQLLAVLGASSRFPPSFFLNRAGLPEFNRACVRRDQSEISDGIMPAAASLSSQTVIRRDTDSDAIRKSSLAAASGV